MKTQEVLFVKDQDSFVTKETTLPEAPAEFNVRIKPLWVGICGSDIVALENNIFDQLSLGHEWIGEVVETGPGVQNLKKGDMVTSAVLIKCGHCPKCLNKEPGCDHQFMLSENKGMLKSLGDLPEFSLVKLPSEVSAETTLLEILAVGENVHTQLLPFLKKDQKILVMGAGALGLSVALVLKNNGYKFQMIEVIKSRIVRAKELGIDCISLGQALLDPSLKGHYEMVIDATGDHLKSSGAWPYLDHFGAKNFLGVILAKYTQQIQFKTPTYFVKNATLKWIQGCTMDSLMLAIKNWTPHLKEIGPKMVTHVYEISEVNEAFAKARDREQAGRVVIRVQAP